jgi:hypothetical protein
MKYFLAERLTYDKLFRISEPKRVTRSLSVRGPPLEVHSYQDGMYYAFNYKSYPSTTGLRWKGYVKFIKPKNPNKPLQHLECIVDCSCPDYKFRWAWANKQRGSGQVGPSSMNQAWNRAPRKTNPSGRPGLCKHILAARRFIYGMLSTFPEELPDTAEKLDKLTKYAQTRWTDFPGAMQAAKEREAEVKRRQRLRNRVGPVLPPPEVPTDRPTDTQNRADTPEPEEETDDFTKVKPPPLPKPTAKAPAPMQPVKPPQPNRRRKEKPLPGGAYPMIDSEDVDTFKNFLMESVVNANGDSMTTTLKEAQKLVEEMEADAMSAPEELTASPAAEPLEPMEPPVSDSAIGADTEEDTALGLLRQMRDFLAQLATALAPEETPDEAGAEAGAIAGEAAEEGGGAESGMPPEPPKDELEDEEEKEKEGEPPNRRPEE